MTDPIMPTGPKTVTITEKWGSITLTLDSSEENYNCADVAGALLRPALLAQGYADSVVEEHVPEVYY